MLLTLGQQVLAQAGAESTLSPAAEYQRRIRQERIGPHYIPKDLADAMRTLDGLISVSSQDSYAQQSEDFAVHKLYFSFGRWLGTNWSLYEGSRFSVYLKSIGVDHPEGQIEFIMRAYHRHLNDSPLDVKQLAQDYKAEKAVADSLRRSRAVVIDSFRAAGPPSGGG